MDVSEPACGRVAESEAEGLVVVGPCRALSDRRASRRRTSRPLDFTVERLVILVYESRVNQLENPVSCFVFHAKLLLEPLGGKPATGAGHQMHGVEPQVVETG